MNVLVDTSIWSLVLRRKNGRKVQEATRLEQFIQDGESIFLVGVILQEILQGIRSDKNFEKVAVTLKAFPLVPLKREDYIFAASLRNQCRAKGVQAGTVDFLIAAAAIRYNCRLFTTDKDFLHIAKHIDLKLL